VAEASWALLPRAAAWWVAFAFGGPAWALAVGSVGAVVSSFARDVRTAQQGVWLVVLLATTATGTLLSAALPMGVGPQVMAGAIGIGAAGLGLWAGGRLVSRDLDR
jgi:hypothetical protein